MGGKTASFNQRISAELRARLDRVYTAHGVTDAEIAADALSAFADYVERAKRYERPIKIVYDEEAGELLKFAVAEAAPAPEANAHPLVKVVDKLSKKALAVEEAKPRPSRGSRK